MPGQSVTLTASVRSDANRQALVDLEVYDRSGRKVFQQFWDNQSFQAGTGRQFSAVWAIPRSLAAGSYTVKIGVFSVAWSTLRHWNNDAARLTVGTATTTTTAPATTTTTKPPATTTTTTRPPATTTTTTTTTTTAPPSSGRFTTLPVGAALPSGAECAVRVRPAAEIRPENAAANANRGGRAYANNRTDWSGFDRVDGDFAGTTDQIIQWAACKWGIDEDIVRAQVIKESWWYQSTNGDNGESWGLGQVRVPYHQSAFEYSAVNARNSSAYNLDYTYASWRACFEGVFTWLNTVERNGTYGPGDVWGCVGIWFSGRWYVGNDAYLNAQGDSVRWHFNNKTWLTSSFING
jgi:autotransporter family porin